MVIVRGSGEQLGCFLISDEAIFWGLGCSHLLKPSRCGKIHNVMRYARGAGVSPIIHSHKSTHKYILDPKPHCACFKIMSRLMRTSFLIIIAGYDQSASRSSLPLVYGIATPCAVEFQKRFLLFACCDCEKVENRIVPITASLYPARWIYGAVFEGLYAGLGRSLIG